MKKKKVLILIPARFKSSRFEGKPLALINNKPMIEVVYSNCLKLKEYTQDLVEFEVAIVTDDEKISDAIEKFSGKYLMVKDEVVSGTERIALAVERYYNDDVDLIINVQGDEPLIESGLLLELIEFHLNNLSQFDIGTVVSKKRNSDQKEFFDPSNVKVIYDSKSSACHYFSRAPIPFIRDTLKPVAPKEWYHHIGIYSYSLNALKNFSSAKVGSYEDMEKLEQLRSIELGLSIGAIESDLKLFGVDTKEDLLKLEEVMSEKESAK